jgi:hypothetical protein
MHLFCPDRRSRKTALVGLLVAFVATLATREENTIRPIHSVE